MRYASNSMTGSHRCQRQYQVTYKGLVERLAAIGVTDSEATLRNKIGGGGFTEAFLIQWLTAMEVASL